MSYIRRLSVFAEGGDDEEKVPDDTFSVRAGDRVSVWSDRKHGRTYSGIVIMVDPETGGMVLEVGGPKAKAAIKKLDQEFGLTPANIRKGRTP